VKKRPQDASAGAAKGVVVRTLVHEMRNHLAVLIANVEALADGKLEPSAERWHSMLQVLRELDVLVDGVVASAEAPAARERIDVCELIGNEALALEAVAREKGVQYAVTRCEQRQAACRNFFGDHARIAQAVQNVLLNAIKFTPPGGVVDVDCRRSCGDLVFSVRDDGPGIAPGEAEAIFEPGYRGSAATGTQGSGTGLGLVKRFVEAHGGAVQASNSDAGATFVLTLPVTDPDTDPPLPRILTSDARRLKG